MVGIIKAFIIVRKYKNKVNKWISTNPVEFFLFLSMGIIIYYILFHIMYNIAGLIFAFLGSGFWGIFWIYLLFLYIIKRCQLSLI